MEKLFDGKELSNEEMIFIGKNLSENKILSFDHGNENPVLSCGLSEKDVDSINKEMAAFSKDTKSLSGMVELVEIKALTDERILRAIIINSLSKTFMPSIHAISGGDSIRKFIEELLKKGGNKEENSD